MACSDDPTALSVDGRVASAESCVGSVLMAASVSAGISRGTGSTKEGPVAIAWIDARDGRSDRLVSQLGQSLSSRESEGESEGDGERSLDTLLGMRLVR